MVVEYPPCPHSQRRSFSGLDEAAAWCTSMEIGEPYLCRVCYHWHVRLPKRLGLEELQRVLGFSLADPDVVQLPPGKICKTAVSYRRRRRVFERDGHKCVSCGSFDELTIDHIIPRSLGGTNAELNLQTLCFACNGAKANRLDGIEWREFGLDGE